MPYGLKRYQETRGSHFLTFSCYHRRPYFDSSGVRELFLSCLEQTRQNYQFYVYGYVVMPEHVHLLLSEPEVAILATAIQALKISLCRRAPEAGWQQAPPFWQKRYYDHNVRDADSFDRKLNYIHLNPVARGLCKAPMDWRWSSFRHYVTAEIGMVEIESEWTAMRRSGRVPHLPEAAPRM